MNDPITIEERERIERQIEFLIGFLQNQWNLHDKISDQFMKKRKMRKTPKVAKLDVLEAVGFDDPRDILSKMCSIISGKRLTMNKTKDYFRIVDKLGLQ